MSTHLEVRAEHVRIGNCLPKILLRGRCLILSHGGPIVWVLMFLLWPAQPAAARSLRLGCP